MHNSMRHTHDTRNETRTRTTHSNALHVAKHEVEFTKVGDPVPPSPTSHGTNSGFCSVRFVLLTPRGVCGRRNVFAGPVARRNGELGKVSEKSGLDRLWGG